LPSFQLTDSFADVVLCLGIWVLLLGAYKEKKSLCFNVLSLWTDPNGRA